jgi:hypothetical protein
LTDLLELALAAHGGLDRWREIERMTATLTLGGALFALKGRPEGLGGVVQASVATRSPRVTFVSFAGSASGAFEPDRVELTAADGEQTERESPRAAFSDHGLDTPWDDLHVLYFAGYALWNYLATPFIFTGPGFAVEEVAPWDEDGERWRRLHVRFPPDMPSHCPEQDFYFDDDGLLRRVDYVAEVVSPRAPVPAAHYCYDHRDFSGLSVPTRRRVFVRGEDGSAARDQLVVELDIEDVAADP